MTAHDRKVVLITRQTQLEELIIKYQTLDQARFYMAQLGMDIHEYEIAHQQYHITKIAMIETLEQWGRYQLLDRTYLPNFIFGDNDIVMTLGQDGLVANVLKYLNGQPLIGINPDPSLYDGILLPFLSQDIDKILLEVANDQRDCENISMAKATLSDGQELYAVNDLFIGPKTHTSARYILSIDGEEEAQSSSGIIVSTGLGSTGWMKSIKSGSIGVAKAFGLTSEIAHTDISDNMRWDDAMLQFAVREPFPSRHSSISIVAGQILGSDHLKITSQMADYGVIFSDGIEDDFLEFRAGVTAEIGVADRVGRLVV